MFAVREKYHIRFLSSNTPCEKAPVSYIDRRYDPLFVIGTFSLLSLQGRLSFSTRSVCGLLLNLPKDKTIVQRCLPFNFHK